VASGGAGPSFFLNVTCCGEALYGLGVPGDRVLFFLVVFFCQVWLQCLSKIFDLQSSRCLLLPSRHHLGSLHDMWFEALAGPKIHNLKRVLEKFSSKMFCVTYLKNLETNLFE
jgi:hypothetical protein